MGKTFQQAALLPFYTTRSQDEYTGEDNLLLCCPIIDLVARRKNYSHGDHIFADGNLLATVEACPKIFRLWTHTIVTRSQIMPHTMKKVSTYQSTTGD